MIVVPGNVDDNQRSLTTLEFIFNRILAVLLVLSLIPYFLTNFLTPVIIIYIVFAPFLWFSKKYHPFANIIFLILALGVYFIPMETLGLGLFRYLKGFRLGGFDFLDMSSLCFITPLIFVSFSIKNVLNNIFTYFKTSTALRNKYFFATLTVVLVTLLVYPFLDPFRLRDQSFPAQGIGDLGLIVLKQSLTFIDQYRKEDGFTSRFDPSSKKYIYRLLLLKQLSKDIQFTKVETDGEKINFITDSRVKCLDCQKDEDPYGLVFPAGKDIDFIITSDQFIKMVEFTEQVDKVDKFVFWN